MIIFLLVPESLETRYCLASLLENSDTSPFQESTYPRSRFPSHCDFANFCFQILQ